MFIWLLLTANEQGTYVELPFHHIGELTLNSLLSYSVHLMFQVNDKILM